MKRTVLLACLFTLLTACVSTPPKTLDQKLAEAQSPSDRREVLRLACLNEAEVVNDKAYPVKAPRKGRSVPRTPQEVRKTKEMCRKMDNYAESRDASTQQVRSELSGECASLLKEYAEKYPEDTRHVSAMTRICHEMLGERKEK